MASTTVYSLDIHTWYECLPLNLPPKHLLFQLFSLSLSLSLSLHLRVPSKVYCASLELDSKMTQQASK